MFAFKFLGGFFFKSCCGISIVVGLSYLFIYFIMAMKAKAGFLLFKISQR